MKHLFINELELKNLVPIFLELKDINDLENEYEINDIIFEKVNNLGSNLDKKYLEYALKSGCFLFLLDGYDEILSHYKDAFLKKLDAFCDNISSYPSNKNIKHPDFNAYSKYFSFNLLPKLSNFSKIISFIS